MSAFPRLFPAMAALALVAACGSDAQTEPQAAGAAPPGASAAPVVKIAELRFVRAFPVETLDPVVGFPGYLGLGETLMRGGPAAAVPQLAESMTRLDPTTWEVELRPNVTFHNGRAVDAAAVVESMTRQYTKRAAVATEVPGLTMTAVDADTLRLVTEKPAPQLDYALADGRLFPIYDAQAMAKAPDPGPGVAGLGAFTGAFSVTSLDDQSLVLTRFDSYWGGAPAVAKVSMRFIKDAGARLAAVQRGEADIAGEMLVPEILRALGTGSDRARMVRSAVPTDANRLHLNTAEGVLVDEKVRKALLLAIDYASIATDFLEGSQTAGEAFLPSGLPYSVVTQQTDPGKAAQLLDEAGWSTGADGMRTKKGEKLTIRQLIYTERPEFEPISIGMQDMLKKLGVTLEIVSQGYDDKMYEDLSRWDTALYADYAVSPSGAPDNYIQSYLRPGGEINFGRVDDDALNAKFDRLATAEGEARIALLREIQVCVAEKAYYATIAFKDDGAVVGPNSAGFIPSYDVDGVLHLAHISPSS